MRERFNFLRSRPGWQGLDVVLLTQIDQAFAAQPELYFEQFYALCERYYLTEDFLSLSGFGAQEPARLGCRMALLLHQKGKELMAKNLTSQNSEYSVAGTLCYYFAGLFHDKYFPAWISLAGCMMRQGNQEEALKYFNKGEKIYVTMQKSSENPLPEEREYLQNFDAGTLQKIKQSLVDDR